MLPLPEPAAAQRYAAVTSYVQRKRLRAAATELLASLVLSSVPAQACDRHDIRLVQDAALQPVPARGRLLRTETLPPVTVNAAVKEDGLPRSATSPSLELGTLVSAASSDHPAPRLWYVCT